MDLYTKHKEILNKSIDALHLRTFFAAYPEHPKAYPEDGDANGRNTFKTHLGRKFEELKVDTSQWIGSEESPYTQEKTGISYPSLTVSEYLEKSKGSLKDWNKVHVTERAGILVESLERFKERFFEVAYATMHTTGQGYMMAFQASGPHAADRAMEAIAGGLEEIRRFPERTTWDKPMGKFNVVLEKKWKAIPRGVSLVIGCSTFPVWNSAPGIYASLITGNPVIVKAHPGAILPIAIVVAEIRNVLRESGINPDICQLAPDTHDKPITKELAEHNDVRIIDFTGNSEFGSYLENLEGKEVFTEKTGVNSAIIDSTTDARKTAANLAFSLTLYSGQMCTAPQNFFIPANGISTPDGTVSYDDFKQLLIDEINGLVDNPKAGPFVLGAIQNANTCDRVKEAGKIGTVVLESRDIQNPMFPEARVMSPSLIEVDSTDKSQFNMELFGPIALLIKTSDTEQAVKLAAQLATEQGAISCAVYCTDNDKKAWMEDELTMAGAPVSFNLHGAIYVNQHAGFSDFHVTGGNPAGNASLTDPKFITRRFSWVGVREMA